MPEQNIDNILFHMRRLAAKLDNAPNVGTETESSGVKTEFSKVFMDAIDKVNDAQSVSKKLQDGFNKGDPNVTLTDIAVAGQKSGIAFEAVVQVRNRLVNAYREIMNMPI
ncbi:MAG: flagellar hook-basal body complex protein FliE [Gammaproteobacteria bacterium]